MVAFTIIVHVIFVKLFTELNKIPTVAFVLLLLTIALNYLIINILSAYTFAKLFSDIELTGIDTRSVFNISAFLLLLGISFLTFVLEKIF